MREEAERLKKGMDHKMETSITEITSKVRQKVRRVFEQAQDEIRATVKKLDEREIKKSWDIDQARIHLSETIGKATSDIDSVLMEEAQKSLKRPFHLQYIN